MVIKNYTVSLEEEVVDKAKLLSKKYGSKISPLLNELLKTWCMKEEGVKKIVI